MKLDSVNLNSVKRSWNRMNYMKQVAEMLELKWNDETNESEEFEIVNHNRKKHKFTHRGLKRKLQGKWFDFNESILFGILTGQATIKRERGKEEE